MRKETSPKNRRSEIDLQAEAPSHKRSNKFNSESYQKWQHMDLVKKLMKDSDPVELEKFFSEAMLNLTDLNTQNQVSPAAANKTLNLLGDSIEVDAYHNGEVGHPMLMDENDSFFLTQQQKVLPHLPLTQSKPHFNKMDFSTLMYAVTESQNDGKLTRNGTS